MGVIQNKVSDSILKVEFINNYSYTFSNILACVAAFNAR